jgi:hypothetical protein
MKLMTKELEKKIPRINPEDASPIEERRVYAKYFHPMSSWTWYVLQYDPKDKIFFGWVKGDFPEYGSFGLPELEEVEVRGLKIERDLYWDDTKTIGQVIRGDVQ